MVASSIAQSRNQIKRTGNGMNKTSVARSRVDTGSHAKNAGLASVRNQATEWSEDDSAVSMT